MKQTGSRRTGHLHQSPRVLILVANGGIIDSLTLAASTSADRGTGQTSPRSASGGDENAVIPVVPKLKAPFYENDDARNRESVYSSYLAAAIPGKVDS